MIHWLNPGALAGLALLALPIVIHLLRTHRADRILFPSLRFVKPSRSAAVRIRPPSDLLLLGLRMLIVAAAVLAAAQPVLVTARRVRAWDGVVVRALVIDDGAAGASGGAAATEQIRQMAASESATAKQSTLIHATDLRDALVKASDWLAAASPARREVVVISPFRLGTLAAEDVALLPPGTGIRLVQAGQPETSRAFEGTALLSAPGIPAEAQAIELASTRTRLTLRASGNNQTGLRVIGAAMSDRDVEGLMRSVATAGTPAPSPGQPIVVAFGADPAIAAVKPLGPSTARWMLRTALRAQADRGLAEAARAAAATELAPATSWTTVANDGKGHPLVRLAALGDSLVAQVAAEPGSFAAAAALRALLQARAGGPARADQEILRIPAAQLAQWSRPAAAVDANAWRHIDRTDARWFWLAALLLIGVEQYLRSQRSARSHEVRRAA